MVESRRLKERPHEPHRKIAGKTKEEYRCEKTEMSKYQGRKGSVPATVRRSAPKLLITERVKPKYPAGDMAEAPNTNPFHHCILASFQKKTQARSKLDQRVMLPYRKSVILAR